MRFRLKGIPVSPGVVLGKVVLFHRAKVVVERKRIEKAYIQIEKQRFLSAIEKAKNELLSIKDKLDSKEAEDHIEILNFNIMMLEDETISSDVLNTIEKELVNAEWAINSLVSKKTEAIRFVKDIYMKERLADIYYLGDRILRNLGGINNEFPKLDEDSVLIAHDISSVDLVAFAKHGAAGLATDTGAATSHSAIVAKSIGITTVMGLGDITLRVSPGDSIFIDGFKGVVIVNPTEEELPAFKKRKIEYQALEKKLRSYAVLPGRTLDGKPIRVSANIEISDEVNLAICYGAEGIGIYRTEFLFTGSPHFPSEEKQFEDYKKLISTFQSPHLTIRTLDIGGDKLPFGMQPKELNPALGLRGIRFSLRDEDIFRTQIRAILRASEFGKVKILIPMVSNISEIREVKRIISEVAGKLSCQHFFKIGIMVETPSAAIMAAEFAEEVDFLSVGTNDLIQYTLAVDRINEQVSYLFTSFHPAVLRLVKRVVEVASEAKVPVAVCGEMAGELISVPLLVAMGVEELSMNVHAIPKVKKFLNSIGEIESKDILENALKLKTEIEVRNYVKDEIIKRWGDLLPVECLEEIFN